MNSKIQVLTKIAHHLNKNNITWSLGGSCMLYLRNLVDTFSDIDIRIKDSDVDNILKLFSNFKLHVRNPNDKYKTTFFIEYTIDDVEIDIISGFTIVSEGLEHFFPLEDTRLNDQVIIDNEIIILDSINEWILYYTLMNREDKIKLLATYKNKSHS
jgi:hypothetical protein